MWAANLFFRVLIAWVVMTGFARAHDNWMHVREHNDISRMQCCGGDEKTGDCEGISAENVWDQPDGSMVIYSSRYKAKVTVSKPKIHVDVPRDPVTKEPIPGMEMYAAAWCGKPRAMVGFTTEMDADPNYTTYCAFRNPGGS